MSTKFILFAIAVTVLLQLSSNNYISYVLEPYQLQSNDEVEVIENHPESNLKLVIVDSYGFLGHFKSRLAIQKGEGPSNVIYRLRQSRAERFIVSDHFISFTNEANLNTPGWFCYKNGKNMSLPSMQAILIHIKATSPSNAIIHENNGKIEVYSSGKLIHKYHYGQYLTKRPLKYFESLETGVYQLQSGKDLQLISQNANDFFNRRSGIFFVPEPGFKISRSFRKDFLFNLVD